MKQVARRGIQSARANEGSAKNRRKVNSSKAFFMSRLPFAGSGQETATHKATAKTCLAAT